MTHEDFAALIIRRAAHAGVPISADLGAGLAAYLELLARWNRRINLTAFDLDSPFEAAIDRLVIESLVAARDVAPADRLCVDVGSGGGSPAIPLKLAVPSLGMILVEAREKKSAFLREAARALNIAGIEVVTGRFEDYCHLVEHRASADLVTLRAVRADRALWSNVVDVLRPAGRVVWFTSSGEDGREMPDQNAGGRPGAEAAKSPIVILARGEIGRLVLPR